MSKKKIGFLSYWGFARGLAYGTLIYAKMLQDEYEVHILKQGLNPVSEEFKKVDVHITEYPHYVVDVNFFTNWVKDNKLDAVVFNEYKQWTDEPDNLVQVAKNLGVKTYGYLVMEKFKPEQTEYYDRIIAPTVSYMRFMRYNRIRNFVYIPHSIDMNEFKKEREKHEGFVFFHPGGFGGVKGRKNTKNVIEAFRRLKNPNTKLLITSQVPIDSLIEVKQNLPENVEIIDRNLTRAQLVDLYFRSDVLIMPSKWETVGLSLLEALSSGIPVVTTDAPPMNEFIRVGINGYLCSPDFKRYDGININVAEVSPAAIKVGMENIMNPDTYPLLARNAKYVANRLYDLEQNKKYFLDFLKGELNGKK